MKRHPWKQTALRNGRVNILPLRDSRYHRPDEKCKCRPRVSQYTNGNRLVTHNAWDLREYYEQGKCFLHDEDFNANGECETCNRRGEELDERARRRRA